VWNIESSRVTYQRADPLFFVASIDPFHSLSESWERHTSNKSRIHIYLPIRPRHLAERDIRPAADSIRQSTLFSIFCFRFHSSNSIKTKRIISCSVLVPIENSLKVPICFRIEHQQETSRPVPSIRGKVEPRNGHPSIRSTLRPVPTTFWYQSWSFLRNSVLSEP